MADDGGNVIVAGFGGSPFRAIGDLYDTLYAEIMKSDGRVSLMEVIGTLELLKRNILIANDPS